MTSEVKAARGRANSGAALMRNGHAPKQPKPSHTSNDFHHFLSPSFDPAAFLNAALPPLAPRQAPAQSQGGPQPVLLAELSAQVQALLSQLNAQTTRLSNTLTQLTEDMLRSGSRLAYEVELLRGETLSLSETLTETLHDNVAKFVPGGLGHEAAAPRGDAAGDASATEPAGAPGGDPEDPDYIKQLQMLTLVRTRLESVVKTFGDAMDFAFPPSEVSVSSSFLSVSAPEPGPEQQSSEDKGQQVLQQLRDDISALLTASKDPVHGIERAASRVEELKELTGVWRGTAEEKGRTKFVDSLAKMVEDRHRELVRDMEQQAAKRDGGKLAPAADSPAARRAAAGSERYTGAAEESRALLGGFRLISQLQKLRSGL